MGLALLLSSLLYFVAFVQMQLCNGCLEKERMGLLEIKAYFIAHGGKAETELASWVDDRASNCCTWNRVKCANVSSGHVTELSLNQLQNYQNPNLMLNVTLFGPFEELLSLNLYGNLYQGWINNEEFPRLKKLENLDLSSNRVKSSILPSLNQLTSLRTLNLQLNWMGGVFSAKDFDNFSQLELLDLSFNGLIGGSLNIEDIQKMRNLKMLDLSNNELNGTIEGLCEMKSLTEVDLYGNMFGGQLPKCLSNLTNLQILDLSNNFFSGNFPFSNLTSLAYLSLFGNYLQGSFSLSILANHSMLQVLYISSQSPKAQIETENTQWSPTFQLKALILRNCKLNKDKGSAIPSFLLYQYDLQYIDLSLNKLVGEFPSWLIQNNPRLEESFLRDNSFVGNLQLSFIRKDIIHLDISSNNISGLLPKDIGIFLPNITYLNLSVNSFEGNIPVSIGEMKGLLCLDLSHNHFSGELPIEMTTNCINLEYLKLSNNFFQGNIPKSSNWMNIQVLYLNNNNFSGTLEDILANNSTKFSVLDISNNSISGVIPSSIGKFSFWILLMAQNQLEGEIPFEFSNITLLGMLDLSQNRLFGPVPNFNLPAMQFLYLQKNSLSGSIPFLLSESSKLVSLDLSDNKFSGNIPDWMDKLSKLRVLLLGRNSFEGPIPIQLCQLKNITIMDLSRNMINGSILSCLKNLSFGMVRNNDNGPNFQLSILNTWSYSWGIYFHSAGVGLSQPQGNPLSDGLLMAVEFRTKSNYYSYKGNILENMTGLDLSCNKLTGIIPPELGNLQQIHALNLSHNHLSGPIPNTFSNLTQVESLDLSYNNLSGVIPSQLTQLNFLSVFNVSYNNISGTPPSTGQFATFDENNYRGNPRMCGPLLKRKCEVVPALPPSQSEGKETVVDMVAFYWSFIAAYITILLGIITVLCINPQWRLAWFHFLDKLMSRCYFLY